MLNNLSIEYLQSNIELKIDIIKMLVLMSSIYYSNFKIMNIKVVSDLKFIIKSCTIVAASIVCFIIEQKTNYITSIITSVFLISIIFDKNTIGNSIFITIVSLTINYSIFIIATTINFIFNIITKLNNDYINIFVITLTQILLVMYFWKIKKLKYGIIFLQKSTQKEYINVSILNISFIIIFSIVLLVNANINLAKGLLPYLIMYIVIMFITIQKSLQLYYKQKLLVQELEETKKELENKKEELQNVEKENINISKKNHTLAHKQKSLEHKIEEMINKSEVSKEEAEELKRRLKEIGKDLYKEKETIELDKTGIPEIDDMMKYMQSECKKNKIEFEYQLKGNIYYMTNNLVSKEDLETLLADHIKNAIIAINHTNNLNRSILVRLGKIDENYGLYIYDSGIEFKPEIFEKLGKEPSTTHPDEGGTGMGFMNTFDTLRKYNASLTIEEYNKPNKDNYTKVLIIKFDGKKEFKIKSYQLKETIKIG